MNVNELMEQKAVTKYRLSKNSGIPYTTVWSLDNITDWWGCCSCGLWVPRNDNGCGCGDSRFLSYEGGRR